ncbi:class I SAM-dependent methyltransferase [Actinoplanes sp. NBRC 103695]|uniref:class I SAM-dependent methyltransferase n=1 Tax=Actinoplanes sp. NBRC 103695 TaxID=3032202 RepID=UPI0024A28F64|nr:class I SAM-dependent methyltransferase [Actinoplanes sp. NBRC 103695]GLZ00373.1 SAM-dependent methyltransferase [Actinoplanes sp. NBRC 103695]
MAHTHFAELLDLDAEVLSDYHATVFAWVGATAPDRPHVLDLGAGTGIGSLSLARALPGATVTALDVDEEMLGHLRHKAEAAGLADRIRTVRADLDQPWPDLGGPADLIWASASMHHMADPGAALSRAYAALRPGGVLAVTELDAFPLFLPATDPHSVLERRAHEAMAAMRDEAGLHMHEDWAARLKAAGFDPVEERRFDIALEPPLPAAGGRYAQLSLERMSHGLAERLSPADVASLAAVAAAVPQRDDLVVRAKRMVYLARR